MPDPTPPPIVVPPIPDPDPAVPPAGPEAGRVLAGVVGYATDRGMLHLYHDRESFRDRLDSGQWSQAGWIDGGVWWHRGPATPPPAEPATPPPAPPAVTRIVIEYSDGSAEGAGGPDAAAIWKHILGLFDFASIHGIGYHGPTLRPIRRAGAAGEDRP